MPKEPSGAHQAAGDLLRRYREAAGLSQEALAEQAGRSPRGLVYLEHGRHRPYPATLRRLADALSLTAREREALALAGRHAAASMPTATQHTTELPVDRRKAPRTDRRNRSSATTTGMIGTPAAGPPHNLPASLSSFIGREHAQARVRELRTTHHLVTEAVRLFTARPGAARHLYLDQRQCPGRGRDLRPAGWHCRWRSNLPRRG